MQIVRSNGLMNLYLHNIGDIYGNVPITLGDALLMDPGYRVDYVFIIDRIFGQPVPINS